MNPCELLSKQLFVLMVRISRIRLRLVTSLGFHGSGQDVFDSESKEAPVDGRTEGEVEVKLFYDEHMTEGRLQDATPDGIVVASEAECLLAPGDWARIEFSLPGTPHRACGLGQLVHTKEGRKREYWLCLSSAGAFFRRLPAPFRTHLNRRGAYRIPVQGIPVQITTSTGGRIVASMRDLSDRGAGLGVPDTEEAIDTRDGSLRLRFTLPGQPELQLDAVLRNQRYANDEIVLGVEFQSGTVEERERITQYCLELAESRRRGEPNESLVPATRRADRTDLATNP